jgi:predicted RNase H-like HicB family nuclease
VMRRFLIVVEKASGNFSAYSPDLPGCVATGATPEETQARMREAIDMHIRGLREDHLPIPEPSATATYVEVTS